MSNFVRQIKQQHETGSKVLSDDGNRNNVNGLSTVLIRFVTELLSDTNPLILDTDSHISVTVQFQRTHDTTDIYHGPLSDSLDELQLAPLNDGPRRRTAKLDSVGPASGGTGRFGFWDLRTIINI